MKERFSLFDSISTGVCIVDAEGRIVFWNTTLELWTGITRTRMLGTELKRYNPVFDGPAYSQRLKGVFLGGPPVYFSSRIHKNLFTAMLPNGSTRSFNITVTPLAEQRDTIEYALFSLLDVTDLETGLDRLQKEKQKYAQELEQSKRLQEELDRKKKIAEKAAVIKTRFLANMSHEIRTPLSGILGFLSLLDRTELDEKQRMYVDMIKTSGDVLKNLVNDILDLSRLEAEKRTIIRRETDLRTVAENVLNILRPLAGKKMLTLTIEVDESVPLRVLTDPDAVTQIVMNLAGNAVKFTDKGSVTARFSCTNVDVLRISVQDTGIGIPENRLNDIFDYFTQLDDSLTKKAMGTGLGLAIVKGLTELLGGKIHVRSTPGVGTVFTLDLPIPRTERGSAEPKTENHRNRHEFYMPGSELLLIDDNEINLLYLQAVLAEYGCSVTTATGAKDALEILKSKSFDALLVDLQMPDISGLDFAAAVRSGAAGTRKDVPLIAVTGFAFEEAREQCLRQGFNDFVTKPIAERTLVQKLHAIISASHIGS